MHYYAIHLPKSAKFDIVVSGGCLVTKKEDSGQLLPNCLLMILTKHYWSLLKITQISKQQPKRLTLTLMRRLFFIEYLHPNQTPTLWLYLRFPLIFMGNQSNKGYFDKECAFASHFPNQPNQNMKLRFIRFIFFSPPCRFLFLSHKILISEQLKRQVIDCYLPLTEWNHIVEVKVFRQGSAAGYSNYGRQQNQPPPPHRY